MSARFYFKEILNELRTAIDQFAWPTHFNLTALEAAVYVINRMELHAEEEFEINTWQIANEISFLSKRASEIGCKSSLESEVTILDAVVYLGLSIAAEATELLDTQKAKEKRGIKDDDE